MQDKPDKTTHFIQVEAVNLYSSIYDTNQLSIIRGSSLLLKLAVEILDAADSPAKRVIAEINKTLSRLPTFALPSWDTRLRAISTGASSGIYAVDTDQPCELAKTIADYLSTHRYLRYFTFTVVFESYHENFQEVKERLIAKARLQQLRQLSLAPQPEGKEPCRLQGTLPASAGMSLHPKGMDHNDKISPACQDRFLLGRFFRNALYRMEIQALQATTEAADERLDGLLKFLEPLQESDEVEESFAKSFNEIADGKDHPNRHLQNKIAVLYFDGNSFGKIQNELVKSAKDQQLFDSQIKAHRRGFLAWLLKQWQDEQDSDKLRMETLLWGGDEMLFVVPASKGMALAQSFYQHSQNWTIKLNDKEKRLTHAGGLVFCHYKTPIARVTQLAKELADEIKKLDYGRGGNFFDYMTLESIDYPAEPLSTFFAKCYGEAAQYRYPLRASTQGDWKTTQTAVNQLLEALPKSQAYEIARKAKTLPKTYSPADRDIERKEQGQTESGDGPESSEFIQQLRRFKQLQSDTDLPKTLETLLWKDVLSPPGDDSSVRWQWLHLVELWDYLAPPMANPSAVQEATTHG